MSFFQRGKKPEIERIAPETKKEKIKKEQKPWSKKERILVLGILFLTVFPAVLLAFSARHWKVGGLPALKLPNISWEQTYIIEGDMNVRKEMENKLADITQAYSGIYGVYVYEIKNNIRWGINESRQFQAASLIKLPVMVLLYKEAEEGNIDLEAKYILKDEDKLSGAGSLQTKPAGSEFSYRELTKLMGKESDNTAYNIVKNMLGDEAINEFLQKTGMTNTSLEQNLTTPQDIGILLNKLYEGKLVSVKSRDELLEYLTNTNFEDWLVNGVPEKVVVAHKFGRETHVINDAGLVLAPNPYVVVIMSDGIVESEADEAIVELSRFIYETTSQN